MIFSSTLAWFSQMLKPNQKISFPLSFFSSPNSVDILCSNTDECKMKELHALFLCLSNILQSFFLPFCLYGAGPFFVFRTREVFLWFISMICLPDRLSPLKVSFCHTFCFYTNEKICLWKNVLWGCSIKSSFNSRTKSLSTIPTFSTQYYPAAELC